MNIYITYDIIGVFQNFLTPLDGYKEFIVYLRPSADDKFYLTEIYKWKEVDLTVKNFSYNVSPLDSENPINYYENIPCAYIDCDGCESDMGVDLPCFIPNHIINLHLKQGNDKLQRRKIGNISYIFYEKEYYLKLGNRTHPLMLGIASESFFRNYIRIHIGIKDYYYISEEFLRYDFVRIIFYLSGFISRFIGDGLKNIHSIFDLPIWAWPTKIIIKDSRHWYGYELTIRKYLKERKYKFKFQHGIVKDGFGNKKYPDFIVYPNEKYNGKSFVIDAKFRSLKNYASLLENEDESIVRKISFTRDDWRSVKISGFKPDNDVIYEILKTSEIKHSKYGDLMKILRQINEYSDLIYSDCSIILSPNVRCNILLEEKLIRFIDTPIYELGEFYFYNSSA